jgi:hypothetical protein
MAAVKLGYRWQAAPDGGRLTMEANPLMMNELAL